MTVGKPFTFNWHEEKRDSFLAWMYLVFVPELSKDHTEWEDLNRRTDKGNAITMQIVINGQEVDAEHFVKRLETNYYQAIPRAAREELQGVHMDEIAEVVREAEQAAVNVLRTRLAAAGITWETDNYDN